MASISNRSPWAVTVRNQPAQYREFRYDRRAEAEAYVAKLAKHGLTASIKRLDNAFRLVAIIDSIRPPGASRVVISRIGSAAKS